MACVRRCVHTRIGGQLAELVPQVVSSPMHCRCVDNLAQPSCGSFTNLTHRSSDVEIQFAHGRRHPRRGQWYSVRRACAENEHLDSHGPWDGRRCSFCSFSFLLVTGYDACLPPTSSAAAEQAPLSPARKELGHNTALTSATTAQQKRWTNERRASEGDSWCRRCRLCRGCG